MLKNRAVIFRTEVSDPKALLADSQLWNNYEFSVYFRSIPGLFPEYFRSNKKHLFSLSKVEFSDSKSAKYFSSLKCSKKIWK